MEESGTMAASAVRGSGIVGGGRRDISGRLEEALRRNAGNYLANRLLRDHRLPGKGMPENERKLALLDFIEAMTDFLGKEDAGRILVEAGRPGVWMRERERATFRKVALSHGPESL